MSINLEHQVREIKEALEQTINNSHVKARLDVQAIIRDGLDNNKDYEIIIGEILDWTGTNTWKR